MAESQAIGTPQEQAVDKLAAKKVEQAIDQEQNAVPYTPVSDCPPLNSMIPLNLVGETLEALAAFREVDSNGEEQDVQSVDNFLLKALNYNSKVSLCAALGGEQSDAVALSIYQMQKGIPKGFILGDMAGIGKGRVCAALMRYAYQIGKIPVFITERPNLFSDNYRDIIDIGGLATNPDGSAFIPKPFIINGHKAGGSKEEYVDGEWIKKRQPSPTSILSSEGNVLIPAPKQSEVKAEISRKGLSKKYQYILATYSQFSGRADNPKKKWLHELAPDCIFILDECHNGAGIGSNTSLYFSNMLPIAGGVAYSSATFAKQPKNMWVYAYNTDIKDTSGGISNLLDSIGEGGLKLQEYLAGSLVRAGQMIRRERSFDNCYVDYNYMPEYTEQDSFDKYDNAVNQFQKLMDFSRTTLFKSAKIKGANRYALENGVELADMPYPRKVDEHYDDWAKRNKGKFMLDYSAGDVANGRFHFIETLLFSLKADYVAEQAVKQYTNPELENLTTEGRMFESNRKPVIAVRDTRESIYEKLGVGVGDIIPKNDLSLYINVLAAKMVEGRIKLQEVGGNKSFAQDDWAINLNEFDDNGASYNSLVAAFEEIDLNVPISPIDRLTEIITSEPRPSWDAFQTTPNLNYGEVTGRKFALKKVEGGYMIVNNTKDANKMTAFTKFNNGEYDMLIINQAGSTGASAQSSSKFRDQRPRVMIIHQVELDVNTEVQKRGRINRTGQVNFPSYMYIVSRIPSEIRRLLMLRRKLRSLDANTTANQQQSIKAAEILDDAGDQIEDFYNHIGLDVLIDTFLPYNPEYETYWKPDEDAEEYHYTMDNWTIDHFCRNLELAPSKMQQEFYNAMNQLYISEVAERKRRGTYDLETDIQDLKASLKTRIIKKRGLDTSPFNESVYVEDDYVMLEGKPLTKEQVDNLVKELTEGLNPREWQRKWTEEYKTYFSKDYIPYQKKKLFDKRDAELENIQDDNERQAIKLKYQEKWRKEGERLKAEYEIMMMWFDKFYPSRGVWIPSNIEAARQVEKCAEIEGWVLARFCGYQFAAGTTLNKYSPSNISMVFATLEGQPKVIIKPTYNNDDLLTCIDARTVASQELAMLDSWTVQHHARELMRLYAGNILDAYPLAQEEVRSNPRATKMRFTKFTTLDNTAIRFGIRVYYEKYVALDPKLTAVSIPVIADDFMEKLRNLDVYEFITDERYGIKIEKNGYYSINLIILWGSVKMLDQQANGENIDSSIKRWKKISPYAYDDYFRNQLFGEDFFERTRGRVRMKTKAQDYYYFHHSFGLNNELDMENFQAILKYFWEQEKMAMVFTGEGGASPVEVVQDPDVYIEAEEEEPVGAEGEYLYALKKPFTEGDPRPSHLIRIDAATPQYPHGIMVVKYPLKPAEAVAFNLYPIADTVAQMMNNLLIGLREDEKVEVVNRIKAMISEGESDIKLGIYLAGIAKKRYYSAEGVFGKLKPAQIGEVARKFIELGIEIAEAEVVEAAPEPIQEIPEVMLDMESAGDFVIMMNY